MVEHFEAELLRAEREVKNLVASLPSSVIGDERALTDTWLTHDPTRLSEEDQVLFWIKHLSLSQAYYLSMEGSEQAGERYSERYESQFGRLETAYRTGHNYGVSNCSMMECQQGKRKLLLL